MILLKMFENQLKTLQEFSFNFLYFLNLHNDDKFTIHNSNKLVYLAGMSQQYPIASHAGPQAYFFNLLNEGASQVQLASLLGVTAEAQDGQRELSQQ